MDRLRSEVLREKDANALLQRDGAAKLEDFETVLSSKNEALQSLQGQILAANQHLARDDGELIEELETFRKEYKRLIAEQKRMLENRDENFQRQRAVLD